MSLLDRVRPALEALDGLVNPSGGSSDSPPQPRRRAVVAGGVAAGTGWLTVVLLATIVWALTPEGTSGWGQVLGLGSALWLLCSGATLTAGGSGFGVVPLLAWAAQMWLLVLAARRVRGSRSVLAVARDVSTGYAVGIAGGALLALLGPARPTVVGLLATLSVPVAAALVSAAGDVDLLDQLPTWALRALAPARRGLLALAGIGLLVVLGSVITRWGTVSGLYATAGVSLGSGLALTLAQLLYLPDLVLWALSVLAGPGFQIAQNGTVSVSGSHPGLLPMVPILGAVPGDAHYPGWVALLLLTPVAVGGLIGWSACRQWTRLAAWRLKAASAGVAVLGCAAVVLGLALLGSGPLGGARLSHLGPNPWAFAGALLLELLLGATLALVADQVRTRFLR
ncbi:MAG TPA: DUF6350 family protein [Dermatophilaceae bacterium]|nr:DUF6350 family protein [Dermatophilaceae bacterium]